MFLDFTAVVNRHNNIFILVLFLNVPRVIRYMKFEVKKILIAWKHKC